MALHDTFKTAAFGGTDGVNEITGSKERGSDDITGFHFLGEVAKFPDAFDGDAALLLDVTEQALGKAVLFLVIKAELHGVVAILACLGFHLENAVGAGENDGDRDGGAAGVIDAGVAEFFS